jgi:hypothetical protein
VAFEILDATAYDNTSQYGWQAIEPKLEKLREAIQDTVDELIDLRGLDKMVSGTAWDGFGQDQLLGMGL